MRRRARPALPGRSGGCRRSRSRPSRCGLRATRSVRGFAAASRAAAPDAAGLRRTRRSRCPRPAPRPARSVAWRARLGGRGARRLGPCAARRPGRDGLGPGVARSGRRRRCAAGRRTSWRAVTTALAPVRRPRADGHGRDEHGARADVGPRADRRAVLLLAVVVRRDRAAADVGVGADVGVAEVGEVLRLGARAPSVRAFTSTKLPTWAPCLEDGAAAQVGEGARRRTPAPMRQPVADVGEGQDAGAGRDLDVGLDDGGARGPRWHAARRGAPPTMRRRSDADGRARGRPAC